MDTKGCDMATHKCLSIPAARKLDIYSVDTE